MVRQRPTAAALVLMTAAVCAGADLPPVVGGVSPSPPPPVIQPEVVQSDRIILLPGGAGGGIRVAPTAPVLDVTPEDRHFASDVALAGPIDPLVGALRSVNFEEREQATDTLLRLSPDRLSEVRSKLAQEHDVEAAARLTEVAVHLFLKARTPLEGASSLLGIKLSLELIRPDVKKTGELRMSVAVAELQPGYPAAQELRVGDRLIAIDGKSFPVDMDVDYFRGQVNARFPGQVVPFTVIRNGREIQVRVQLAGIPAAGPLNLEQTIDQRNAALSRFLMSLESGIKSAPLVVKDKTPPSQGFDINIQD